MRSRWIIAKLLAAVLALFAAALGASAGETLYGTVREVRGPDQVVLATGDSAYLVHILGAEVDPAFTGPAMALLDSLLAGRRARLRIEGIDDGVLEGRLFTADSAVGRNRDVAKVLLLRGFARVAGEVEDPFGEMVKAQGLACRDSLGIWAYTTGDRGEQCKLRAR